MSLFTGLYPDVHQVDSPDRVLNPLIRTLPQILQEFGYSTRGVVSNTWLEGRFGFQRGFDSYSVIPDRLLYADEVNKMAFKQLNDSREKPLFLFVQYMDPHSDFWENNQNTLPYFCPGPFRSSYSENDGQFCNELGHCATQYLLDADTYKQRLPESQMKTLIDLYGCGIRYTDQALGDLFYRLKRKRIYDDSLIIVTADHGEEFREHGEFIHSQTYDETIRVPLVIKFPKQEYAGKIIRGNVAESIDLYPTLLDYLNLPSNTSLQGKNLLPLIHGQNKISGYAFSREKILTSRYALRSSDYKLIYDFDAKRMELYDLKDDPHERKNVGKRQPRRAEAMRQDLLRSIVRNQQHAKKLATPVDPNQLSRSQKERLKSIGYLD